MKTLLVFAVLLSTVSALASEGQFQESKFHLLKMKCEPESEEGADATPQSPPLDVDDPATPGCNKWEVNVLVSANVALAERSWELPLLDINYGIGDNLQLKYEVPLERAETDLSSSTAIGNSKFGIKYLFYEDEEDKLQFAIYPQIEFSSSGSSSDGNVTTLPLLISKKLGASAYGDIRLTTNLGYNLSTRADTRDFLNFAVGVGVPLLKSFSIMGEVSTEQALTKSPEKVRDQLVKGDVGWIGTLGKKLQWFGSVGKSLYTSDRLNHTYAVLGMRILPGG